MEGSKLAAFSAALLEYVMARAETTNLEAYTGPHLTRLVIGNATFQAATLEATFDEAVLWLLTKKVNLTPAQYAALGREYEQRQTADDIKLIEDLTRGGLNRLGELTEAQRAERRILLTRTLAELGPEALTGSFAEILERVNKKSGLEDVEVVELWDCLTAYVAHHAHERTVQVATDALSGSNTKPN